MIRGPAILRSEMKTTRSAFVFISFLTLLFNLLAPTPTVASIELSIAYQGPLTGPESIYGIPQLNGTKYAITKFNETSSTYKIKIVPVDDQGDPSMAAARAPSIAANAEIIGLVGPAYSAAAIASAPYYKSAGLVMLSPSAANYRLTDPNSTVYAGPVFHRVTSPNYGPALAINSVKGISSPAAFVVDAGVTGPTSQTSAIVRTLGNLNAKVLGVETIPDNTTDFSAPIAKIKASAANAVIFLGYTSNSAAFTKQLRDAGLTAMLTIAPIESTSDYLALTGSKAEGVRLTLPALEKIEQTSATLEQDFKKTTGSNSGMYSIEAIDATNILLDCISKGKITRNTLLDCVHEYRGKSFLGATISFDAYGDPIGGYTYTATVKDGKLLLTDPVVNESLVREATTSNDARVDLSSISAKTVNPGETIRWTLDVTVQPGYIKGIYLQIVDPNGQSRNLTLDTSYRFKTYVVDKAETFKATMTLLTHSTLASGKYFVGQVCLEAEKRDCVTDPKYAKLFDPNQQNRRADLSEFGFTVADSKITIREEPLKLTQISLRKSSYSPGEVLTYEVEARGSMKLWNANMNITFGNNGATSYCQSANSLNCSFSQDKTTGITKIVFAFPLPEDLPPLKIQPTFIAIASTPSVSDSSDPSINSTANWMTNRYYYDGVTRSDLGQELSQEQTFDFSKYQVTILDTGGPKKNPPTWTNLSWANNPVAAGEEAILNIDLEGYSRYISGVYLYGLISTSGTQIGLKNLRVVRVKPDSSASIYPLVKSGTYQIKVSIPRNAKPGSYRLGQLTVESSNCEAKSLVEWSTKTSTGTGQCFGLNMWQTTYFNGSVKVDPWPGYENTPLLTIEVLPATKPKLPHLSLVSAEANTLKIDYNYDDELNCSFKSDSGALIHQEVRKGQSTNGNNNLIITDLKPDTKVKITGSCLGTDGLQGVPEVVEFKTGKPFPPAAPKVSTTELGVDYAKFEFVYRDGFKYEVKTSSGEATVTKGSIQVSKLSPNTKVELQLSITDAYSQTTLGDPIIFTTNKPMPPVLPKFDFFLKTQTRIFLKTNFDSKYEYEFSSDKGTIEIIGNQVAISGLQAGDKVNLQLNVRDKYGQVVSFSDTYQSELPIPPLAPSLRTDSILATEINLLVSQQAGTKLLAKTNRGVIQVDGDKIWITGLTPKTSVTVSVYSQDAFGQISGTTTRTFTTAAARQQSITCTNGKVTKVVVGINPKCPVGYKKK